jgi:hypothetical protein
VAAAGAHAVQDLTVAGREFAERQDDGAALLQTVWIDVVVQFEDFLRVEVWTWSGFY